jgi:type I restriction enzyme S subunit
MSFAAYPIYKSSGDEWLSEVPEHWEVLPLKHFAEVDNSGCYGVEPADGDHIRPVATTAQIDSEGRFDVGRMSDRGFSAQELARYECSPGDVLVVKSSGSAENIISGKAGLVREDTPAFVFSNFLMRLRHRKDVCLPSFLYSLLISHLTRERIKQMCSTTTYPNLQVGLYTSAKLPCPPLSEQTQIARFLDHETARIDALIEEQQRLIELLKEKRQAVISHAVTKGLDPTVPMKDSGVEWLGEVPAHWELTRVGWQCIVGNGCTPARDNLDYWEDGHYPWLNSSKVNLDRVVDADQFVTSKALKECALPIVKPGCVLMAITGEGKTRGMVTITEIEATINQHVAFIEPRGGRLLATYLHDWLSANYSRIRHDSADWGSTKAAITCADIRAYPLPLPPEKEQEAICQFVGSRSALFDGLMSAAEENVALLQERRSALISAAVTGKIDVRGWQPSASTQAPQLEVAEAH